jgi:Fibronectin type III domain
MKHPVLPVIGLAIFVFPVLVWLSLSEASALGAGPTNSASWVQLAWNPSPATNVGVINYNLYYGPASATYTNSFSVGTNLTGSVSNLVRGSTYFFAVTAVCATNLLESDFSNEISYTSPKPPTPPTTFKIISGN